MSLLSTAAPAVPTDGAVTLVLDPEDTAACASVVSRLASLPHGRVVCHPTPGGAPTWLGCDLLLALGKRFDAIRPEHMRSQAWELAGVWLRAEAVEHVFVLRAHGLQVRALERLGGLQVSTGVHLWLVSACRGLTTAERQALNQTHCQTMHRDAFLQRWRHAAPAARTPQPRSLPGAFPAVPGVDFPIFRAMCRRLLDPASFAVVDRTFAAALADTLSWLDTRRSIREQFRTLELELDELDFKIPYTSRDRERRLQLRHALDAAWYGFEREASNQFQALTSASGSPTETLVRLRAAQAAYFRFGLLLEADVPPQALRGIAEFGPTIPTWPTVCAASARLPWRLPLHWRLPGSWAHTPWHRCAWASSPPRARCSNCAEGSGVCSQPPPRRWSARSSSSAGTRAQARTMPSSAGKVGRQPIQPCCAVCSSRSAAASRSRSRRRSARSRPASAGRLASD